jgi:hypothetical protein
MDTASDQKLGLRIDDVAWREVGDEVVILEVATTTYLTLNGSARVLWKRLVDGVTRWELTEALVQRYGITTERADRDVEAFLGVLEQRSLLEQVG